MNAPMWEILVPVERRNRSEPTGKPLRYTLKHHQVWDEKVRAISGGITILQPARGQWVSPDGQLLVEKMIPVRVVATEDEIERIIALTLEYYDQQAVLCYKVSNHVIIRHREDSK